MTGWQVFLHGPQRGARCQDQRHFRFPQWPGARRRDQSHHLRRHGRVCFAAVASPSSSPSPSPPPPPPPSSSPSLFVIVITSVPWYPRCWSRRDSLAPTGTVSVGPFGGAECLCVSCTCCSCFLLLLLLLLLLLCAWTPGTRGTTWATRWRTAKPAWRTPSCTCMYECMYVWTFAHSFMRRRY